MSGLGRAARTTEPATAPLRLETVGALWWSVLDAAETALRAAWASLRTEELHVLGGRLAVERVSTLELLEAVPRLDACVLGSQLLVSAGTPTRRWP